MLLPGTGDAAAAVLLPRDQDTPGPRIHPGPVKIKAADTAAALLIFKTRNSNAALPDSGLRHCLQPPGI